MVNRTFSHSGEHRVMQRHARIAAAFLALGMTGFGSPAVAQVSGYQQYGMFSCVGRFATFVRRQIDTEPSQLTFVIDWLTPAIVTDRGVPGRVTSVTPLQVTFDIQYPTYHASYFISRIDGTISQTGESNGVFRGTCDLTPLATRF